MAKPGPTFRFGVGSEAVGYSSVWRVWAPADKSDVYIAARAIAGEFKVSLHASGVCQLGLTTQAAEKRGVAPDHRLLDRWDLPEAENGFRLPFTLRFPVVSLRPIMYREGRDGKPLCWIVPAPGKEAVEIFFGFLDRELNAGDWPGRMGPGTTPVASLPLPDGRTFWIVAFPRDFEDHFLAEMEAAKPRARSLFAHVDTSDVKDADTLRVFLFGRQDNGRRFLCEQTAAEVLEDG